jgi:hypothetical protein
LSEAEEARPPEGRLIEDARARVRPKLSIIQAAQRAGISDSRWRQITSGYMYVAGKRTPTVGPADTVARMAHVVGVSADQLRKAGREDAAEELERILADEPRLRRTVVDEKAGWTAVSVPSDASEDEVQAGIDQVLDYALRMAEAAYDTRRAEQIRTIIARRRDGDDRHHQ